MSPFCLLALWFLSKHTINRKVFRAGVTIISRITTVYNNYLTHSLEFTSLIFVWHSPFFLSIYKQCSSYKLPHNFFHDSCFLVTILNAWIALRVQALENKPEALGLYKHFYVYDISKIHEHWPCASSKGAFVGCGVTLFYWVDALRPVVNVSLEEVTLFTMDIYLFFFTIFLYFALYLSSLKLCRLKWFSILLCPSFRFIENSMKKQWSIALYRGKHSEDLNF